MPAFTFTSPEGQKYTINGPDGATQEQAFEILQKHLGESPPAQTADEAMVSPEGQKLAGELRSKAESLRPHEYSILPISEDERGRPRFDANAGILGSIKRAFTLPGEVVTGKIDPTSDEGIARAFEMAALTSGKSPASGMSAGIASQQYPKVLSRHGVPQSAERLGIEIPRAAVSDNRIVQESGKIASNAPIVGAPLMAASERAIQGLQGASEAAATGYGAGGVSGPNVASRIGGTLRGLADEEALANREAAQRATEAARGAATAQDEMAAGVASGALDAQRGRVLGRIDTLEGTARELARREFGQMTPQQVGETITTRLRTAEETARNLKTQLYETAGDTGASLDANAVREVHGRVAQSLEDAGRVIDPALTPAASRMMSRLSEFSQLRIPNRAVGARLPADAAAQAETGIAAVDFRGVEQTRKVLNGFSQAASNDADRAASRLIIRNFDDWVADSFDRALYSGSEEALSAVQAARSANRQWRENFGFNSNTDADRIVNRIATGEVTPQEAANWIIGATKVGASGASARLLQRIATATGNDPEAAAAIRSGIWNRLSQNAEGVERGTPEQVANGIFEFLNGSGQPVSRAMFDGRQRRIMEVYAQTIREGARGRQALERGARPVRTETTRVADVRPDVGPMEELANAVLGRNGKTDEALFATIEAYSRSGSRGDLKTMGRLLDVIPQEARGDLAAAIIGKMGASPRAASQFSGDVWLSNWRLMTPQAKAMLFGMTGNLRQSLDDIATVSQRFKEMQKFANPSGTARSAMAGGFAAWLFSEPFSAIGAAIGVNALSRILATPATASSLSKWMRAYEGAARNPGRATNSMLAIATRNLSATITDKLGVSVDPATILRGAAPGQLPARADDESQGVVPPERR